MGRKKINGLFDDGTFEVTEILLAADEIILVKVSQKQNWIVMVDYIS